MPRIQKKTLSKCAVDAIDAISSSHPIPFSILLNGSDDKSTVPVEERTRVAKISATAAAGVNVDCENLRPSGMLTIPPAFARPQILGGCFIHAICRSQSLSGPSHAEALQTDYSHEEASEAGQKSSQGDALISDPVEGHTVA
jgi:hypothetical protein